MAMSAIRILVVSGFPERLDSLYKSLAAKGVERSRVEIIRAPTGSGWRDLDEVSLPSPYWRDERTPKLRSNGHQCCGHGHMLAWKRVIDLGEPAIILEDDAQLLRRLPDNLPDDHLRISYLGYKCMDSWPDSVIVGGWRRAPFVWWACAYGLHPHAAGILLESAQRSLQIPVDEFIPWHCGLGVTEDRNGLALTGVHGFADGLTAWCAAEPIVEPSFAEPSRTEIHDPAFDFRVVLFGTDGERLRPRIETAESKGFAVKPLGVGRPGWDTSREGGREKFEWLLEYLEPMTYRERINTIVLAMDGYDTAIHASTPQDVLRVYGSLRWPCVVSGERNYWPPRGMENLFEPRDYGDDDEQGGSSSPYKYPCSGVFIGVAEDMRGSIRWALETFPDEQDDQALMHRIVLARPNRWRVDDGASLVMSLCKSEDDVGADGVNRVTGTYPRVYHANGSATMSAHVRMTGQLEPWTQLYGCAQQIMELPHGMYLVPLMSPEDAARLGERLLALAETWQPLKSDDVPGDEYRGALLDPLKALIERHVFALLNPRISPARVKSTRDIFAIRHSPDRQSRLRLHNDISYMSGSLKLLEADQGGELYLPRQNWSDRVMEPGCSVWWPSAISHPHTTTPVKSGTRVAVTVWTDR